MSSESNNNNPHNLHNPNNNNIIPSIVFDATYGSSSDLTNSLNNLNLTNGPPSIIVGTGSIGDLSTDTVNDSYFHNYINHCDERFKSPEQQKLIRLILERVIALRCNVSDVLDYWTLFTSSRDDSSVVTQTPPFDLEFQQLFTQLTQLAKHPLVERWEKGYNWTEPFIPFDIRPRYYKAKILSAQEKESSKSNSMENGNVKNSNSNYVYDDSETEGIIAQLRTLKMAAMLSKTASDVLGNSIFSLYSEHPSFQELEEKHINEIANNSTNKSTGNEMETVTENSEEENVQIYWNNPQLSLPGYLRSIHRHQTNSRYYAIKNLPNGNPQAPTVLFGPHPTMDISSLSSISTLTRVINILDSIVTSFKSPPFYHIFFNTKQEIDCIEFGFPFIFRMLVSVKNENKEFFEMYRVSVFSYNENLPSPFVSQLTQHIPQSVSKYTSLLSGNIVFREMSIQATGAMQHFLYIYTNNQTKHRELHLTAFSEFMIWMSGYRNVFRNPCSGCGHRLALVSLSPVPSCYSNSIYYEHQVTPSSNGQLLPPLIRPFNLSHPQLTTHQFHPICAIFHRTLHLPTQTSNINTSNSNSTTQQNAPNLNHYN